MTHPKEPTCDECTANARVDDFNGMEAYACWYPQMGGCVGKAVITFYRDHCDDRDDLGCCFEAYVWHDGEFPFNGEGEYDKRCPVTLHHCVASQFIEFGQFVMDKQAGTSQ